MIGDGNEILFINDDRVLLNKVDSLLKSRGIVALSDSEGNTQYFVDIRNLEGNTAKQGGRGQDISPVPENLKELENIKMNLTIRNVFARYGIDIGLCGSRILLYIIREMMNNSLSPDMPLKSLYHQAGLEFDMTYDQIERNVRYAVLKSYFTGSRIKSSLIIRMLYDAVISEFWNAKGNK